MTKMQLIEQLSKKMEVNHAEAEGIVDAFFQAIVDALKKEDKVELRGFGSFRVKKRAARMARNPRTGAAVPVPEKVIPYFKASKELKQLIEGS
ncbi:MAG: integration host factor subunit beta [Acidobacteria bacterium]|nr:integration host factor subunit beta [Acidobacteriota bacterium]